MPNYWKLDLMTSYKVTKDSMLQLNIYNLTDELYYAQYYGSRRSRVGSLGMLTYRYRW